MARAIAIVLALLTAGIPGGLAQQEHLARGGTLAEGVTKHADIAYAEVDGVEPQRLMLDIYAPEGAENAPVMLYVHGGGWARGDRSAVARKPEFFCGGGWLFASTNYRLVPQVTPADQVRDIARAVAWLREYAAQYGGDPERIFLMGHSAGAHLVALVSTDPAPLREAGLELDALSGSIVVDTGTLDLEAYMARLGSAAIFRNAFGTDRDFWREVSPLAHVAPDTGIPPFLLMMQGTRIKLEAVQRFADALTASGADAKLVHLRGHTHASINRSIGEPDADTTAAVAAFLSGLGAPVAPGPGANAPDVRMPDTGALRPENIEAAARYSAERDGVSLLVMIGGEIVFEDYPNEGGVDRAWELASGTKSFSGVMAAAAAADGLLDLDEPVSATITEWSDQPGKGEMTIRQLLSLTGGQQTGGERGRVPTYAAALEAPMVTQPGERFSYGAVPFQVFGEVMRRKLGGCPLEYMQQRIFEPIGLEHGHWRRGVDGHPHLPSGAALTARDWAKLGELMRLGGEWDGEQVIPRELLDQCTQPSEANPCYGLTWWLARPATRQQLPAGDALSALMASMARIPDAPEDLFLAGGLGGQRLYVSREMEMVVVRQASGVLDYLLGRRQMSFSDPAFMRMMLAGN